MSGAAGFMRKPTPSRPKTETTKKDGYSDEFVARMKRGEKRLSGKPISGDELMAQIKAALENK